MRVVVSVAFLGEALVVVATRGIAIGVAVAHPYAEVFPLHAFLRTGALNKLHRDGDSAIRGDIALQIGIVGACTLSSGLYAYSTVDGEAYAIGSPVEPLMCHLLGEGADAAIALLFVATTGRGGQTDCCEQQRCCKQEMYESEVFHGWWFLVC